MYKFEWDTANEVIRLSISGGGDAASLSNATEKFFSLLKNLSGKVNILIDCQGGELDIELFKKINVEPQYSGLFKEKIEYIAIFGLEFFQRMKLELMFNIGGFEKARFFDGEEDALNWLKLA